MAIVVNIDVMMAKRKMRLQDLAREIGITQANLSILKTNKARAIRFSTQIGLRGVESSKIPFKYSLTIIKIVPSSYEKIIFQNNVFSVFYK